MFEDVGRQFTKLLRLEDPFDVKSIIVHLTHNDIEYAEDDICRIAFLDNPSARMTKNSSVPR